ncbi:MAG: Maf family protein [Endomicrobiaceae bacterium]|nr:Maf family protein [Endomicrobiaceae bacterium]
MSKNNIKEQIILASKSPRRIELLKQWGLNFKIISSNIEEKTNLKRPSSIVKYLSLEKAKNVKKNIKNAVIIAADTIVVLNGKIVGKPKDHKHSMEILNELNGSLHKVYTGVTITDDNKTVVFYDVATVKMQMLPKSRLNTLIGKHMDKAGAYAVQDKDDCFVKKIYGDYYTVVGLPYIKLKKEMKKFNIALK